MAKSYEFNGVLVEERILFAKFEIGRPTDELGFVDEDLTVTPALTPNGEILRLIDETTSEVLGRLSLADSFSTDYLQN